MSPDYLPGLPGITWNSSSEAVCTELPHLLIKATRPARQCAHCGRLRIDDDARKLNACAPEGGATKWVFAAVQDGETRGRVSERQR